MPNPLNLHPVPATSPAWLRPTLLKWNLVAPVIAAGAAWQSGWLAALTVMASAHWPWLYATLNPGSAWWGPIQTRLAENSEAHNQIWLTIDDGPDPDDTPRILDLLDAAGATATFFVIGRKVEKWPHLVAEILRRGHTLGNHTHSHPAGHFWALPGSRIHHEISTCQQAIAAACGGYPTTWFRAPAGLRNHALHPVLSRHGMSLAGWSARGFDGVATDPDRIVSRISSGLHAGAIVLLHEGKCASAGRRLAPLVVAQVLELIRERQLKTVSAPNSLKQASI